MINELAEQIWARPMFHEDAAILGEANLRRRYIKSDDGKIEEERLVRLLRSAVVLAGSNNLEHRRLAYSITTSAAELAGDEFPGIPYLLLVALSRMGNFPACSYAKLKFNVSENALPTLIVSEWYHRSQPNTFRVGDTDIALTDFQANLWRELNRGASVGVSAPTSAGKSYVLQSYARQQLTSRHADRVAFLVPTRALINQVSGDISQWVGAENVSCELVTTPIPKSVDLPSRALYVVTQERLQLLQIGHDDLYFDIMIVDEAQSIGDGPRGVLLSSVIEEALERNPKTQILFAGPNIKNPERLSRMFTVEPKPVQTEEATVSQNIIFVDCDNTNPKKAALSFAAEDKKISLGVIESDQPLVDHKAKLINLPLILGAGAQNLIYAMGPAECEIIAFGLSDVDKHEEDAYLQELSDFIKDAVHPEYQLAQSVLARVGFHYGRLPSLVRKSIEDAFSVGALRYLVTTSTLLYGVNLPAQNLFLHNPQKGQNQPISSVDFWNLAGRAGRLGKEFSGNIFLIDYGEWSNDPMAGEKQQIIAPTIETHVVDRVSELIEYVNDPGRVPDRNTPDELENTFVKLTRDHFLNRLDETLNRVGLPHEDMRHEELVGAIKNAVQGSNITGDVLASSPTVSIHRQQSLYEWLNRSLKKKSPSYIIPKHPMDTSAYPSYLAAIKRCHGAILKYPTEDKSHRYFAMMALNWMKGHPIPRIVDASYKYKRDSGQNPNIASVIRATLTEIENELRFKYVRLFSCYNAVLELVLKDNGMADLTASIPSIPTYLEVGACSPTMISFMGLGLSRYTAVKLQSLARRMDMSQNQAREWLRRQRLDSLDIPRASVAEIRRMVVGT